MLSRQIVSLISFCGILLVLSASEGLADCPRVLVDRLVSGTGSYGGISLTFDSSYPVGGDLYSIGISRFSTGQVRSYVFDGGTHNAEGTVEIDATTSYSKRQFEIGVTNGPSGNRWVSVWQKVTGLTPPNEIYKRVFDDNLQLPLTASPVFVDQSCSNSARTAVAADNIPDNQAVAVAFAQTCLTNETPGLTVLNPDGSVLVAPVLADGGYKSRQILGVTVDSFKRYGNNYFVAVGWLEASGGYFKVKYQVYGFGSNGLVAMSPSGWVVRSIPASSATSIGEVRIAASENTVFLAWDEYSEAWGARAQSHAYYQSFNFFGTSYGVVNLIEEDNGYYTLNPDIVVSKWTSPTGSIKTLFLVSYYRVLEDCIPSQPPYGNDCLYPMLNLFRSDGYGAFADITGPQFLSFLPSDLMGVYAGTRAQIFTDNCIYDPEDPEPESGIVMAGAYNSLISLVPLADRGTRRSFFFVYSSGLASSAMSSNYFVADDEVSELLDLRQDPYYALSHDGYIESPELDDEVPVSWDMQ
jgi:hypothetical protein